MKQNNRVQGRSGHFISNLKLKRLRNFQSVFITLSLGFAFSACSGPQDKISVQLQSQDGIVGGEKVTEADFASRSTVSLYIPVNGKFLNFCTGTLIQEDLIITAAHCVRDVAKSLKLDDVEFASQLQVAFGSDVVAEQSDKRVVFTGVQAVKIHDNYDMDALQKSELVAMYDVALVRIAERAPLGFQPATVLKDPSLLQKGTKLLLAGFGLTNGISPRKAEALMQVEVEIDEPLFTATQFRYKVQDRRSACRGDSGGPAFVKINDEEYHLAGVTSWGDQFCQQFGVYTAVTAVNDWIETASEELNAAPVASGF